MNDPSANSRRPTRDPWWQRAACHGRVDLEWIEPTTRAKALCRTVCAACPVRAECLHTALVNGEAWGIWGGLTPDERAEIAATNDYPMPEVRPAHGTNPRYAKHGCRCRLCRQAHTIYERNRREHLQPPQLQKAEDQNG